MIDFKYFSTHLRLTSIHFFPLKEAIDKKENIKKTFNEMKEMK